MLRVMINNHTHALATAYRCITTARRWCTTCTKGNFDVNKQNVYLMKCTTRMSLYSCLYECHQHYFTSSLPQYAAQTGFTGMNRDTNTGRYTNKNNSASSNASIPQFRCGSCSKTFRLLNALQHHIMTKHAGAAKVEKNVNGKFVELGADEIKETNNNNSNNRNNEKNSNTSSESTSADVVNNIENTAINANNNISKEHYHTVSNTSLPFTPESGGGHRFTQFSGKAESQPLHATTSTGAVPGFPGLFASSNNIDAAPQAHPPPPSSHLGNAINNEDSLSDNEGVHRENVNDDSDEANKEQRQYMCHICQKVFRLEAALQHHYQAKHNVEMPSLSSSLSVNPLSSLNPFGNNSSSAFMKAPLYNTSTNIGTGENTTFNEGSNNFVSNMFAAAPTTTATTSNNLFGSKSMTQNDDTSKQDMLHSTQYIRQQQQQQQQSSSNLASAGADKQSQENTNMLRPAQYHLSVAPHAPESGDIACHWRCVNSCVLMGTISEIMEGYEYNEHVLQFTVTTTFDGPAPGEPDKDFHTIRVYGDEYWKLLKESFVVEGASVLVSGRLRLVPQYDNAMKKYYHYPLVQVYQGTGCVEQV